VLPCAYGRIDRFRVPAGSRLVADFSQGSPDGFLAVLATDDAERAVQDLRTQAEGTDPALLRTTEAPYLETVESPIGTVRRLVVADNAGGGACSATPSVDGRWVLVSAGGD
jgi:hypothetical protein